MRNAAKIGLALILALMLLSAAALAEGLTSDDGAPVVPGTADEPVSETEIDLGGADAPGDADEEAPVDDGPFVIEGTTLVSYQGPGGNVIVPSEVTAIGDRAFYCGADIDESCSGRRAVTGVTLLEGVGHIGAEAFAECPLTFVNLPDSLVDIGEGAFRASGLNDAIIPAAVKRISKRAFQGCASMEELIIESGVLRLGEEAFAGCGMLRNVRIPEGVVSIGAGAFSDCTGLTGVTISTGLVSLGESAFSGCGKLATVVLPQTLESVGERCFAGCLSLQNLELPEGVTGLPKGVFYGCRGLVRVDLPNSLKMIDEGAFEGCDNLIGVSAVNSVVLSDAVASVGASAFKDCGSISEVKIGKGLVTLGDGAFDGCLQLNRVTVHGHGEGISAIAFRDIDVDPYFDLYCDTPLAKWVAAQGARARISHDFVDVPAVEPTVEAPGLTAGVRCAWCGEVSQAQTTIPKLPSAVKLSKTGAVTLVQGKTVTLTATLEPADSASALTWTSSNKAVATVDTKGVVKGVKKGTATITVTTANQMSASVKLSVIAPSPTKVAISTGKTATLEMGKTLKLKTQFTPDDAESALTWKSSKQSVATVSAKGVVKGVKKGAATITVTTANKKRARIKITVTARKPKKVAITAGKTTTLVAGKTLKLKTQLTPDDAESALTWKSSNEAVATVSAKGVVKAIKKGTATITVTTANNKRAKIKVKVSAPSPTKIAITAGKTATLKVGQTLKLETELSPAGAESKLTWKSDQSSVATVNAKGTVKGIAPGEAQITVSTANGKLARITVAVVPA